MLADLELQQARLDSSATQAEALAQLQQDLGAETEAQGSGGEEAHRNAATVLQVGGRVVGRGGCRMGGRAVSRVHQLKLVLFVCFCFCFA